MRMLRPRFVPLILLLSLHPVAALAQLAMCAAIPEDRERLACYDGLARQAGPALPDAPVAGATAPPETAGPAPHSELEERWDLRPDLDRGLFKLQPYKPVYLMLHDTSGVNGNPASPTRVVAAGPDIELDRLEAKMQFSLKTKVAKDLLAGTASLWFGYTQQSYWQAANSRYSSPFRETDYEPEAILIQPLQFRLAGIQARYAGLALNHQSNGRTGGLSRSWNRLIGQFAAESGRWSFELRSWTRVFEASGERDDNPDIEDFVGRGEVKAVRRTGRQIITLTGRHTLRSGAGSRGSGRLDWAFPLAGAINAHLQLFSGYGENLLDYNHRQTTIGVGVSFFD
jgi:phospholipase A1